ncbi:MAG: LysR family transcriptional regulator [Pseudomonadota bacterium]
MQIDKLSFHSMHECMEIPDWRLLRAFIAVMQEGTLSAAARKLGATQPTLGRQIRELETLSGDVLFLRKGARLEPTEQATALYPRAVEVERAVQSLGRAFLAENEAARAIRITMPTVLAQELAPHLIRTLWGAVGPSIILEVAASDDIQDLSRREADLALRLTDPSQGDLVARRLGEVSVGLYASRRYLQETPPPRDLDDLRGHVLIMPTSSGLAGFDAFAELLASAKCVRTDDLRLRLSMLRAGLGVSSCHDWIARRDPDLARVLPDVTVGVMPLWLVATEDIRRSAPLRRVTEVIAPFVKAIIGGEAKSRGS